MKTMTKVLTVAGALVLALSLTAPVQATCGNPSVIQTIDAAGQWSFITNPQFRESPEYYGTDAYGPLIISYDYIDDAPLSPAANISFWRLGTGDTAIGLGDDNGAFDMIAAGGFYFYSIPTGYFPTYPSYGVARGGQVFSSWDGGATDGCVQANSCMCLLITDEDGIDGSWAVVGGQSDPNFLTSLNAVGTDGVANRAPIQLLNQPGPQINLAVRANPGVNNDLDLTVALTPAAASYGDPACDCGPTGFKVVQQIVPRGSAAPSTRDIAAWSEPLLSTGVAQPAGGNPFGGATVRSVCGTLEEDVWLAGQLIFDSGFGVTHVSSNSTRIECGTTLADPDDKPQPIRPRSDRPKPRRR
jgi:hypothetical protein